MWHSPHAWRRSNVCLSVPRRTSRMHAPEAGDVRQRRAPAAALYSAWPVETGRGCRKRYEYPIGKPDIGQSRQQRGHLRHPPGRHAPAATRSCAAAQACEDSRPIRPNGGPLLHNHCCAITAAQPRAQHAHRAATGQRRRARLQSRAQPTRHRRMRPQASGNRSATRTAPTDQRAFPLPAHTARPCACDRHQAPAAINTIASAVMPSASAPPKTAAGFSRWDRRAMPRPPLTTD